jgi:hypothetical protein
MRTFAASSLPACVRSIAWQRLTLLACCVRCVRGVCDGCVDVFAAMRTRLRLVALCVRACVRVLVVVVFVVVWLLLLLLLRRA